jgi:prepilin signal peptidase PulO-like enzyme (type II secretory pathway)
MAAMSDTGKNQIWDESQRLKILGFGFLMMTIGVGLHAVPPRWPEWLKDSIAVGAFTMIYWGGRWLLRWFGWTPTTTKDDLFRDP